MMGSELEPIVHNQASNEIQHQFLDATKAKEILNWSPEFTLDRGLEQTIIWYENFLDSQQQMRDKSRSILSYTDFETLPLSELAIKQTAHN